MQQISVSVAVALLAETNLSFFGIKPPTPSWGIDAGRSYRFMRLASWLVFMRGFAMLLMTVADNLHDALDPSTREEKPAHELG
jgi:ABC-type dipeptide/oligopeptide/nickel transport system permease subunit